MIRRKIAGDLAPWIIEAKASLIASFANGIEKDRAAARTERIWYKFSGPYRLPPDAARRAAAAILSVTGPERIVWGSDWPWTQHEGRHRYRETLDWLAAWVPDAGIRKTVLTRNPFRLFRSWAVDTSEQAWHEEGRI